MKREVRLIGGPLDGQRRDVHTHWQQTTFYWPEEPVEREWTEGLFMLVTPITVETYRRVDADTFEHCRTQAAIGDRDL